MKVLSTILFLLFAYPSSAFSITFAQLALGGGDETIIMVSNRSATTQMPSCKLRQGSGQPWNSQWTANGTSFSTSDQSFFSIIADHQSANIVLRGDSITRTGDLEIEPLENSNTNLNYLAISYFYVFKENAVTKTSTGSGSSSRGKLLFFPVERMVRDKTDIGYAISPISGTPPFQVLITGYLWNGIMVGSKSVNYTGHMSELFSRTFPDLRDDFLGHVIISSEQTVCGEVLRMEITAITFLLTSTPAGFPAVVY
jgi:hypothetical protein